MAIKIFNQSTKTTIGFNLINQFNPRIIPIVNNESLDEFNSIEELLDLTKEISNILFFNSRIDAKLSFKKNWLKKYCKIEYYKNNSPKDSIISSKELGYLCEIVDNNLKDLIETSRELITLVKTQEHNKSRKTQIGLSIDKILSKNQLPFFVDLFRFGLNSENKSYKLNTISNSMIKIQEAIKNNLSKYTSSNSTGQCIEYVSLNYYTLNKKPIDYKKIESELQEEHDKLEKQYIVLKTYKSRIKSAFEEFVNSSEFSIDGVENFEYHKFAINNEITKIDNKYNSIQEFENDKKLVSEILERPNNDLLNLFGQTKSGNYEQEISKYKDLTDKIKKIGNQINGVKKDSNKYKNLVFDKSNISKKRGKFYTKQFSSYIDFCNGYQGFAKKYGNVTASLRNISYSRIESEKTRSFGLIAKNIQNNSVYLLTIPEDKINPQILNKFSREVDKKTWSIANLNSLTLRSLEKLCFANLYDGDKYILGKSSNSFAPNVSDEIGQDKYRKIASSFQKKQISNKELVRFYLDVLQTNYAKKVLNLKLFDIEKIVSKEYSDLSHFEKVLNKEFYKFNFLSLDDFELEEFIKEFGGRLELLSANYLKNNNNHSVLWLKAIKNIFEETDEIIRINPELKISFVDYLEGFEGKPFHRRKQPRFLLSVNVNEGVYVQNKNNFVSDSEFEEIIKGYEKESISGSNTDNIFDNYFYGIDRGEKELFTLGLFKYKNTVNQQSDEYGDQYKYEVQQIKVYSLGQNNFEKTKILESKNSKKEIVAYQNPSYFQDLFTERDIPFCLDLSTSKVIADKIVIDGDINTYLKLKFEYAKRIISNYLGQEFTEAKKLELKNDEGCVSKVVLMYENRGKKEGRAVYVFDSKYNNIVDKQLVLGELNKYLTDSIEAKVNGQVLGELLEMKKINNLVKSISGNIVGVLNKIYDKYPGFIVFEKSPNKSPEKFNLSSIIERSVYRSMEKKKYVPASTKQLINYIDSYKLKGTEMLKGLVIGNLVYVNESNTSKLCPVCLTKNNNSEDKFVNAKYKCASCGFDTKENNSKFPELTNPDDLACYNIAMRGLNLLITKFKKE